MTFSLNIPVFCSQCAILDFGHRTIREPLVKDRVCSKGPFLAWTPSCAVTQLKEDGWRPRMNHSDEIDMHEQPQCPAPLRSRPSELTQRAAKRGELDYVHSRLMEAIDSGEDFAEEFRVFERARLSKLFLVNLHTLDPDYVRVCFEGDTMAGFLICGPELGNLWYYWGYVFPEVRKPNMAMVFMRQFVNHWDNGRFHKISLYTTRNNLASLALIKRFRFNHKCDLNDHIMGQDFMLFERRLNKTVTDYDSGTFVPFRIRLLNRARCAVGLL